MTGDDDRRALIDFPLDDWGDDPLDMWERVQRSEARRARKLRRRLAAEAPDAVKRALAKGLSVRSYSVNGVTITLGEPDTAPVETDTPEQLRRLI